MRHHRRHIGASAEEGDIPEVEQTSQTYDDIEAKGGRREDEHLGRDRHVRVGAVLREREEERHRKRTEHEHSAVACGDDGDPREQAGPVEGHGSPGDEDQQEAEDRAVFLAECIGGAEQHDRHQHNDDEDLNPGRQAHGHWVHHGVGLHLPRSRDHGDCASKRDIYAGICVSQTATRLQGYEHRGQAHEEQEGHGERFEATSRVEQGIEFGEEPTPENEQEDRDPRTDQHQNLQATGGQVERQIAEQALDV